MRIELLIIGTLMDFMFQNRSCDQQRAYKKMDYHIMIIKTRIKKPKSFNATLVGKSIAFLEEVTGIRSKSDGNYFGRCNPTKQDYTAWKDWYFKNKTKLYWDEKQHKILVKPTN